jgi:hypothetical protein
MKPFIYSLVLIFALSVGNTLLGQGRGGGAGGGRVGGPPEIPTRPEPASNADRGNRQNSASDRNASEDRKAQGTNDPSLQLANNSGLSKQVAKLFPEGTDLGLKASGFKNLGQFVSAAHLSKNLEISFDALKVEMMDGSSLSDAVHELKPELTQNTVKAEVKKAEDQAKKDLK